MQNELSNLSSFFYKKLDKKSEACMNGFFMHEFSELTGTHASKIISVIYDEYR